MADIIPLKFIKTTGGAVVAPSELNPSDTIPANVINGLPAATGAWSVATAPEYRNPAVELLLCQRHYEIFFLGGTNGTINAANQVLGIGVAWNVEKRAIPSISLVAGSDVSTAFPSGLASFNNIDKRSAIAFKMSTGGSSNAGWYQAIAIDARL
ncbi:hypothetical protein SNK04_014367 [Fusarium graminearum]